MWRLLMSAWGWIVVGAGFSALFSMGLVTVVLFVFSVPTGVVVGALVGVPGAILLTLVIGSRGNPPRSALRFVVTLETVGVLGALTGCSVVIWWPFVRHPSMAVPAWALVNGLFAFVGVCLIGRGVGRGLASSHLSAWGIATPPSSLRPRSQRHQEKVRARAIPHHLGETFSK